MRPIESYRNMTEATVNANHACAQRHRIDQGIQRESWPDAGTFKLLGHRLTQCLLGLIAMSEDDCEASAVQTPAQFDPTSHGPLFV
jgi:hypothetical protein